MTSNHDRGPTRDDAEAPRPDGDDLHDHEAHTPRSRTARRDGRGPEDHGFTCIRCKAGVPRSAWGTAHRNHCPHCLWSRHVDEHPGDRASMCRSAMEAIGIEVRGNGEWAIIHRCTACGTLRANRIAGDDSERALLALALRPIARPAFPLDDVRT